MLGLQYFACGRCDTVFALPEAPSRCSRCGSGRLTELTDEGTAAAYFAPPDDETA